jgi:hypothetical protein
MLKMTPSSNNSMKMESISNAPIFGIKEAFNLIGIKELTANIYALPKFKKNTQETKIKSNNSK